jgi:hypothetical protein
MPKQPKQTQLKLRVSDALRRRLEQEAERNHRSLSAEIVARVEESFALTRVKKETQALVEKVEANVEAQEKTIMEFEAKIGERLGLFGKRMAHLANKIAAVRARIDLEQIDPKEGAKVVGNALQGIEEALRSANQIDAVEPKKGAKP